MVGAAEQREVKKGLAEGALDIVVGTHAVLGKTVEFKDLGLVVIDEEQHFGVGHKERLKELRAEVHVLTLSATPIPRTLQLAMTGVRELSIIATPPVDRLAVRTFVSPFDALIVREALLRERYRGGQSFYVCPRIEDLDEAAAFLRQNVPEAKFVVAHGQMAASELEDKIGAFYDGKYDILLSTSIVESGPRHSPRQHADRPSRRHVRPRRSSISCAAASGARRCAPTRSSPRRPTNRSRRRRRSGSRCCNRSTRSGAGFQLASHDLDLRGAGNLLGEEQSGHIKEVGYELYQQMVQDAVERLKSGDDEPAEDMWSPTISLGAPVTIPESYIPDLTTRLSLYRRLSRARGRSRDRRDGGGDRRPLRAAAAGGRAADEAGADQGALPPRACREARRRRAKGMTLAFRDNSFANPTGLVKWVTGAGLARPRAAGHAHRGERRFRGAGRPARRAR